MRKLTQLNETAQTKLCDELSTQASLLGLERWDERNAKPTSNSYGLCGSCTHFTFAKSEYTILAAKCYELRISLHASNPVTDCTEYSKRGALTLNAMFDMAYLIDPDPAPTAGF